MAAAPFTAGSQRTTYLYYRHTLPVRIMHWINVIALTLLLMSGLQIFNAHPALYWGKSSYTGRPPLLQITHARRRTRRARSASRACWAASSTPPACSGFSEHRRVTRSAAAFPSLDRRFPADYWLAMARSWHFFFAWMFVLNGACVRRSTRCSAGI